MDESDNNLKLKICSEILWCKTHIFLLELKLFFLLADIKVFFKYTENIHILMNSNLYASNLSSFDFTFDDISK